MLIDIHTHCCRPRHPKIKRPNGTTYPSPEQLVGMLDNARIDKAVVLLAASPEKRYTALGTEEVLDICAEYPDRLIPFCNLDPRFLTNDANADFLPLLEAYREMGVRGVGEYMPNIPFDDPLNMNFFGQVEEIGMPLTFHLAPQQGGFYGCVDDPGLPRLEKTLKTFPKLTFLGHSQLFWAEIGTNAVQAGTRVPYPKGKVTPGRLVELMRAYPNLHGDLSAGSGYGAISRDREFGLAFLEEFQDRLYFGTDIACCPQVLPQIPYFAELKTKRLISEQAYENITWKNANRLLGLRIEAQHCAGGPLPRRRGPGCGA